MTAQASPWDLPGLDGWLEDLSEQLRRGLLLLPPMAVAPIGLVDALVARCRGLHDCGEIRCDARDCRQPAAILAEPLGCTPTLDALASPACDQQLVILRLADGLPAQGKSWLTFLRRLAQARREKPGLCVLVPDAPAALCGQDLPCAEDWRYSLSRGDRVIWAEEHLPRGRSGLAAELAVALAVELCGWRLDLAAELARASVEDLIRPLDWLARRGSDSAAETGKGDACPLALYRGGDSAQLRRRVWRAHLFTFFPRLEEQRLDFIDRYRKRLRVDEHLRSLGVTSVDDIELGALRHQLRGALDRGDADRLEALARLRNRLAHRQPGDPEDCRTVLAIKDP
ncbi:hypothetical protein [Tabrizicola sp. YIM 78059]|uniref:hypothetical protein n=1 Tax=Tabrizicola sp. YIM 78059 TaxID=2529861 RepID=UPI0010AAE26E|nr:hypothetical protein [Tabrizicola sp. YIM 78059]